MNESCTPWQVASSAVDHVILRWLRWPRGRCVWLPFRATPFVPCTVNWPSFDVTLLVVMRTPLSAMNAANRLSWLSSLRRSHCTWSVSWTMGPTESPPDTVQCTLQVTVTVAGQRHGCVNKWLHTPWLPVNDHLRIWLRLSQLLLFHMWRPSHVCCHISLQLEAILVKVLSCRYSVTSKFAIRTACKTSANLFIPGWCRTTGTKKRGNQFFTQVLCHPYSPQIVPDVFLEVQHAKKMKWIGECTL